MTNASSKTQYIHKLQTMLSAISRTLIREEHPDLNRVLALIGESFGANRAYIFRTRDNNAIAQNTHEWCDAHTEPQIHNLQDLVVNTMPWWFNKMSAGENIVFSNIQNMPAAAAVEKIILEAQDVKSILIAPIIYEKQKPLLGFLGLDITSGLRDWLPEEVYYLRSAAEILSAWFLSRHAEERLAESERRRTLIVQNTPIFLFSFNPEGHITYAESTALSHYGVNAADFVGRNVFALADDYPDTLDAARRAAAGEHIRRTLTFHDTHFDTFLHPVTDASGKLKECIGLALDISERVRTRQALEESHQKIQMLIEAHPDIIFIADENGVYKSVHTSDKTLLYAPEKELIGKSAQQVFSPEIAARFNHVIRTVLDSGRVLTYDYPLVTSGATRWFSAQVAPMRAPHKKPREVIWVARDITERVKSEKLREDFLSNVSHDLKTPLTVIKGRVENLVDGAMGVLNPEQRMALTAVQSNCETLVNMVNDIVDIARLESGKSDIHYQSFNISDFIHAAISNIQFACSKSPRTRVTAKLHHHEPDIRADRAMLCRVLDNLLSNALRYAQKKVSVRTETADNTLRVSVTDDGPGIPADKLKSIFNKFERIRAADKPLQDTGSGLGLAICKHIVDLHRGRIWAESAPRRRTRFYFEIPLSPPPKTSPDSDKQ